MLSLEVYTGYCRKESPYNPHHGHQRQHFTVWVKGIFLVYSDRNLTLSKVLYLKDMHSEMKLCFLKNNCCLDRSVWAHVLAVIGELY